MHITSAGEQYVKSDLSSGQVPAGSRGGQNAGECLHGQRNQATRRVESFDKFVLILASPAGRQIIFKRAISTVLPNAPERTTPLSAPTEILSRGGGRSEINLWLAGAERAAFSGSTRRHRRKRE
ncbi:RNA chaperone Hfq [Paraburkholderia sp. WC7.3g]|uniref:RNA chaperone Hfq n=1 Tax=Paraburkholderia sp. WC7.3g TaxID=2991070 RepID=UPI003D2514D1